jgi:minor extracellular serine protease Vpr
MSLAAVAQSPAQHYTLILDDSPVAERFASRAEAQSDAASNYRQQVETKQQALRSELAVRNIQVLGSVSTLLNAIFVVAPEERLGELKGLPGVKGVVAERRYRANLNRATQLVNAPAAWTSLGGAQNAGAGIKIAIIDNGIDQTHPAFQDSSLKMPAGYPICKTTYPGGAALDLPNCSAFTNNKVIVARSYIPVLAAGSDPSNPAADSRPDDYLPRDRAGHGTAVASAAAGASNTGPTGLTFNGVAPKAYLGSYKVFGSPQVNNFATDAVIAMALEDAVNDHMDIASLSLGAAATTGPLDSGAACGKAPGVPCDLVPTVVESAVKAGMVVVIAAGNDGDGTSSYNAPALNTIESPGDSPSAITVGSTTNSHYLVEGVEVSGLNVPTNLQRIAGVFGDGVFPSGALAAQLREVTQLGDNGLACNTLPAGSLAGAFALIQRGTCDFLTKVTNAQNAGASGVIFYMADQSAIVSPSNLASTSIPAIMISNNDGTALKSFIAANARQTVLIDPGAFEQSKSAFNMLSFYSSLGPTTGDNAIKPDLVATGGSSVYFTDMYLATQSYDVLGDMYSANRYTAGSGTSFATPLVAGAAALVKQAHPNFTPAQIKSALVNAASQDVVSDEQGHTVSVESLGAGKLDVGAATQTSVTSDTPSISFGIVSSVPIARQIRLTNTGSSSVNLSLAVTPATAATGASLALDNASLNLAPGASGSVNVVLSGSVPPAGAYSGVVSIQGASSTLRIPYLFLAGSGTIDNLIVVSSPSDGAVGQDAGQFAVKLIDSNGVPVSGATVSFTASSGAALKNIQSTTNKNGIASAEAFLGSQPGSYDFTASAGGISWDLPPVTAMAQPAITASGVVDGASFASGKPVAPGSYISIFGSNLSNTTSSATTATLPLAIAYVTVSFDVPSAQLSLPGHLVYVSPNQVNVQVPWELQGQSSVQIKVTVSDSSGSAYGNVVTVPLSDYAPAFFEIGGGQVAAQDVSFQLIGTANPARRGQVVQLYANGLGPVDGQPASGDYAPLLPLSTCKSQATVTIGSQNADVGFCGLAPGFPGLYQINATVPLGLAAGTYPVTVSIGGQTSKASHIVVR